MDLVLVAHREAIILIFSEIKLGEEYIALESGVSRMVDFHRKMDIESEMIEVIILNEAMMIGSGAIAER